ncbi:hypothetical protein QEH56_11375 [Pelagicoccus enzymogenes]|uniref:hypothetical protein n=1 Tax=Pelagicoccus enzymogenes TaxID=2773457 RepID=UPI00280F5F4E|nr:hypothetical protein [Pelagicoccus enzymogenes]MDQ8198755.1 hypothetical protein [Pelagicoccus enzymogenes]
MDLKIDSEERFELPEEDGLLRLVRLERDGKDWIRLPNGEALEVLGRERKFVLEPDCPGVFLQLGEALKPEAWRVGASLEPGDLDCVRSLRSGLARDALLMVSGGVGDPADALALREAGADVILVEAGMVFKGPGLVKRCNEALGSASVNPEDAEVRSVFNRAWLWATGLGLAMWIGGMATFALAVSRVLLPYDEHFLGLGWRELRDGNSLLFHFMAHDRGTLAGVMLGLGWLYLALGREGIRRSEHGAKTAVVASALIGFASFFSFFGFGYFDTLHAFVAAILFQVAVQVMVGVEGGGERLARPVEVEGPAWRLGQWGQLAWIVHALGLLVAGGVILVIGMGAVFVSEDLQYLCLSKEEAMGLGERLVSVVAHDRATLGGMLLASGVASLLGQLWLFRKHARWLWWGMFGFGLPAYLAAIGVHFGVGYVDLLHLAPAFAGMGLWLLGLLMSRGYLFGRD